MHVAQKHYCPPISITVVTVDDSTYGGNDDFTNLEKSHPSKKQNYISHFMWAELDTQPIDLQNPRSNKADSVQIPLQ